MRKPLLIAIALFTLGFCQVGTIAFMRDGAFQGTLYPTTVDSFSYIPTDQLLRLGEGRRYFATQKFKESIRLWGSRIVFSPENPIVAIDGTPYNMGLPTRLHPDGLLVPLTGFFEALAVASRSQLIFGADTIHLNSMSPGAAIPAADTTTEAPAQQQPTAPQTQQSQESKGDKKGVIVIDAGHGGKDPGAIGPSGVREKDIVLPLAKLLRDELEALGFDAVLTRYGDVFLTLSQRTQIANKMSADLFISLHCNASHSGESHGTQAFYLSPAKTDDARAAAALENQALLLEDEPIIDNLDELQYIMADMAQSAHQRESSILAYIIEQNLSDSLGTVARGPAGAEFYVLYGAFMPAVLVEAAFISNADEEKILALPQNQRSIAKGIAAGIMQFWENIKR